MNFTNSQCLSALCLNVGDYLKSGLQTEVQTGSAIDSTAVLAGHRGKVCEYYSARFCDPSLSSEPILSSIIQKAFVNIPFL